MVLTLRKNEVLFPSLSTALSLAVSDHAEVPNRSAFSGVVPSGKARGSGLALG